jgi:hypothetical protein
MEIERRWRGDAWGRRRWWGRRSWGWTEIAEERWSYRYKAMCSEIKYSYSWVNIGATMLPGCDNKWCVRAEFAAPIIYRYFADFFLVPWASPNGAKWFGASIILPHNRQDELCSLFVAYRYRNLRLIWLYSAETEIHWIKHNNEIDNKQTPNSSVSD